MSTQLTEQEREDLLLDFATSAMSALAPPWLRPLATSLRPSAG